MLLVVNLSKMRNPTLVISPDIRGCGDYACANNVCVLMQMALALDGFAAHYILAPAIAGGLRFGWLSGQQHLRFFFFAGSSFHCMFKFSRPDFTSV